MVQHPVEYSGSQCAVIIEYFRPVFEGSICGNDHGSLFVAMADHLEEQVGADLINRQIPQFILCKVKYYVKLGVETFYTSIFYSIQLYIKKS